MAARKIHTTLRDDWKAKIQASHIIRRFVQHFDGDLELTKTQVEVGKILLGKVAPDLARQELTGKDEGPVELVVRWHEPK
jgi:hypothetical protein